jgi:CRISPR system Cascade subunit CasB
MSEATTPSISQASQKAESLSQLVGRIAWMLTNQAPPGDLAALRRLKPGDPSCLAFWKIAAAYLESSLPGGGPRRDETENRWSVILAAMAELEGLHQPRRPLGSALAEVDYSEIRLLRLLRARDEALADAVRTMAHFLRSKTTGANQSDLAQLVLSAGRRDEEAVRRRIARNYYSAKPRV